MTDRVTLCLAILQVYYRTMCAHPSRFLLLAVSTFLVMTPPTEAAGLSFSAIRAQCAALLFGDRVSRRTVARLVDEHRLGIRSGKEVAPREVPMVFEGGPKDRDLYNAPGEIETSYRGERTTLFIGREESAASETDMKVAFYAKTKRGTYRYMNGSVGVPHLQLQDPFVSEIVTENGKELILGGVKVWPVVENAKETLAYATVFYRDYGKGIEHLELFLTGPDRMKDIRFAQTPDRKRITVFTRPQHSSADRGGRGKVGMFHVSSLEEVTADKIADAPIFRHQFSDKEWGGVNAAVYLDNRRLGVIGHYARFDKAGNRDYVGVSWIVDADTRVIANPKVILERADLPGGVERGSKRSDLKNVLFPGGFRVNPDKTLSVWGGEGDKKTFHAIIENPF